MRYLSFALASLLVVPRLASANSCPINTALVESYNVRLGCPAVVHVRASHAASFTPVLIAMRGGTEVDITGAVAEINETLPITFLEYDAECNESFVERDEPFVRFEIQLGANAQVGDVVGDPGIAVIEASAMPCPPPSPPSDYACSDTGLCTLPDTDGDGIPDSQEDGGCSTGGGSSLGLSLALLALVRRRRR